MTGTIDLYFRVAEDPDEASRKVGTVDLDAILDLFHPEGSLLTRIIKSWDGLYGDLSYDISGQFTPYGFEVVFSLPT